jgi:hypothetical protein
VNKKDISITFPEGTYVVDSMSGIAYKTDANGEAIQSTIEPLYCLDPSKVQMPEEKPNRTWNDVLIILGLAMIGYSAYLQIKNEETAFNFQNMFL